MCMLCVCDVWCVPSVCIMLHWFEWKYFYTGICDFELWKLGRVRKFCSMRSTCMRAQSHYECVAAHCVLNYSYHRHRWFPLILLLLHFISFVSFIFIFVFICSFVLFRFVSFCSSFFIIFAVEGSWPETGPFNIRTTYSTIFHTYSEGTLT